MIRSFTIPHTVVWESTTRCNLRCKHCGSGCGEKSKTPEMSTDMAKKALGGLATFGVENLVVSGGEFTVRADWKILTEFALGKFQTVRIITNGRLGKRMVKKLRSMPNLDRLAISVSLDGDQELHNQCRGAGSFEAATELIENLDPISKSVISTFTKNNFTHRLEMLKLCLNLKLGVWTIQMGLPAGRMEKHHALSLTDLRDLADFVWCAKEIGEQYGLAVIPDDCFGYRHPMRTDDPWTGCPAGKELVSVFANGDLSGCPTLGHTIVGNILQDQLTEVWQKRFPVVRERPNSCRKCSKCPGGCQEVERLFGQQFCF